MANSDIVYIYKVNNEKEFEFVQKYAFERGYTWEYIYSEIGNINYNKKYHNIFFISKRLIT